MCELFGFTGAKQKDVRQELTEFFRHSIIHSSGWGMADFSPTDGQRRIRFYTEPVSARKSTFVSSLLQQPVSCQNVMAHIRRATVGGISSKNCHPFVRVDVSGRQWHLIHNGTIFSGLLLMPYRKKQEGDTDSERILLYLIDQMDAAITKKGAALNSFERFRVVEQMISALSYRNKLNLIIYDGSQMYVHVNMKDTLYSRETEEGTCIATVPLTEEKWEPLPLTTLQVFQNGQLKYRGKNHHNEYIDTIHLTDMSYEYNI